MFLNFLRSPDGDGGGAPGMGDGGGDGGAGTGTLTGLEGLSQEYLADPSAKKFTDINALFKGYKEIEQQLGTSIVIPGKDDGQEAWDKKLYSKTGWPEKVEGYSRLDKTKLPDGMTYNEEFEKFYYSTCHELRLNNKQANGLLQKLNGRQLENNTAFDTQDKANLEQSKKDMIAEFGSEEGSAKAQEGAFRFIDKFGDPEFKKFVDESRLGNNVMFMKFMHKMGANWSEDHAITGGRDGGGDGFAQSQDQIQKLINEKMKDDRYKNGDMKFINDELMPLMAQKKKADQKRM